MPGTQQAAKLLIPAHARSSVLTDSVKTENLMMRRLAEYLALLGSSLSLRCREVWLEYGSQDLGGLLFSCLGGMFVAIRAESEADFHHESVDEFFS